MFTWLKRRIRAKGNDTGGWKFLGSLLSQQWSRDNDSNGIFRTPTISELERLPKNHAVVKICVGRLASTAGKPWLEVGYWSGPTRDTWNPTPNHPALGILQRPNDYHSANDLTQLLVKRWALTGYAFSQKLRNSAGVPVEIWPYPTSWIEVKEGVGTQLIKSFRVAPSHGRSKWDVSPEDMTWVSDVDPSVLWGSVAPAYSCWRDIELDHEREQFMGEMLKNNRSPGPIFSKKGTYTDQQIDRLRKMIDDRLGRGKRNRPLAVDEETSVIIPEPLKDIDWPGLTGLLETRICMAFGMSPILAHTRAGIESSTYSNYETALKSFYYDTMADLWEMLAAALTRSLLLMEGESKLEFRYRYDLLPIFADTAEKAQRAVLLVDNGLITQEEGRAMIGLDSKPVQQLRGDDTE